MELLVSGFVCQNWLVTSKGWRVNQNKTQRKRMTWIFLNLFLAQFYRSRLLPLAFETSFEHRSTQLNFFGFFNAQFSLFHWKKNSSDFFFISLSFILSVFGCAMENTIHGCPLKIPQPARSTPRWWRKCNDESKFITTNIAISDRKTRQFEPPRPGRGDTHI